MVQDDQRKKFLRWYLGFSGALLDVVVIWLLYVITTFLLSAPVGSGEGAGIAGAAVVLIATLAVLTSTVAIPVSSWFETRYHKPVTWVRRVFFAGTAGPMVLLLILFVLILGAQGRQGLSLVMSAETFHNWWEFILFLLGIPRSFT